jgi:hypothetical protein
MIPPTERIIYFSHLSHSREDDQYARIRDGSVKKFSSSLIHLLLTAGQSF